MEILFAVLALAIGGGAGYGANSYISKQKASDADTKAKKLLDDAKEEAKNKVLDAKHEAVKINAELKQEERERRNKIDASEKRVADRETLLDNKLDQIEKRTEALGKTEKEIEAIKEEIRGIRTRQENNLEKIAKLKKEDAQKKLMEMTERDIKNDLVEYIEKRKRDATENADEIAKDIMSQAMERLATGTASERTISTVAIPNDGDKGKIIGKEGRNIQTLERLTGVEIIIDESTGVITISGFNPIRRQVAKKALEALVKDGRIHPAKIEETVEKAQREIDEEVKVAGEQAAREAKVLGLPSEISKTMGMLKFRTSYSQNVLHHSVEMAHLAAMIAEEIGADVQVSRTAAFLHDLGKAVSHEVEGKHHHITGDMMRKAGFDEATTHAAEAHHDDIEATTPEALIVRVVDALSGGRPGARGDKLENYVKRMTDLENVANAFSGIKKSYAISAGREIRVFVDPEEIDDLSAIKLARDVATKIEASLKYPGTIKVNVIRETRAEEYAK